MDRRFPPLPAGLKEWLGLHEMIQQHGSKAFKTFLSEMQARTLEFQQAVALHGKVEEIESLHAEAEKAREAAKTEADALLEKAAKEIKGTQARLEREQAEFSYEREASLRDLDERQTKVLQRENAVASREQALVDREKTLRSEEARLVDERQRLAELKAQLDAQTRKIQQARELVG